MTPLRYGWLMLGRRAFVVGLGLALAACKRRPAADAIRAFVVREPTEVLGEKYVGAPPEVSPGSTFFDGPRPLLWVSPQPSESMDQALAAAETWLAKAPLAPGERWAFEDYRGDDGIGNASGLLTAD